MLKAFLIIGGLVLAFLVWRILSVPLGMRKRDRALDRQLTPLRQKLEAGDPVADEEVAELAARPELRFPLFDLLRDNDRSELMPSDYGSGESQGAAALAYWMMHPNELQAAPEQIEWLVSGEVMQGGAAKPLHVYRYRMPAGHWAAEDGWILGIAGPMNPDIDPYTELPPAFSLVSDVEGNRSPEEIIDWYTEMLRARELAD